MDVDLWGGTEHKSKRQARLVSGYRIFFWGIWQVVLLPGPGAAHSAVCPPLEEAALTAAPARRRPTSFLMVIGRCHPIVEGFEMASRQG